MDNNSDISTNFDDNENDNNIDNGINKIYKNANTMRIFLRKHALHIL